jgi:hypothetical protein
MRIDKEADSAWRLGGGHDRFPGRCWSTRPEMGELPTAQHAPSLRLVRYPPIYFSSPRMALGMSSWPMNREHHCP